MALVRAGAHMSITGGVRRVEVSPAPGCDDRLRAGRAFPKLEETMATLPADEDYARSVLTIFSGMRVRAKQSLRSSQVRSEFLSHNLGRPFDFDAAVEYAVSQGWITFQLDAIRLTEAGYAEM